MPRITTLQWLGIICAVVYIPLWILIIHASLDVAPFQKRIPISSHDSVEYVTLAENILSNQHFSMDAQAPSTPDTFRTPGYPFFLAIVLAVFKSYFAAIFLQIVMVWLSAVIIYKMGKEIFSSRVGFAAALGFMLDPTVIYHTMVILSDTAFVFLFLLTIYLLFFKGNPSSGMSTERKHLYRRALFGGIILGAAVLVRPVALYLLPVLLFFHWLYIEHIRKASGQRRWQDLILVCVCLTIGMSVVVFPWMLRNRIETGSLGISSITAYNLYEFNIPGFLEWKGVPNASTVMEAKSGVSEPGARLLQNSARITKVTEEAVFADPISYAEYHVLGSIPFITSSGLSVIDQANAFGFEHALFPGAIPPGLFIAESTIWVVIFLLACLAWLIFRRDWRISLFMAVILYFWFVTGPVAYARYRIPAEPFLLILAVGTASWIFASFKNLRQKLKR